MQDRAEHLSKEHHSTPAQDSAPRGCGVAEGLDWAKSGSLNRDELEEKVYGVAVNLTQEFDEPAERRRFKRVRKRLGLDLTAEENAVIVAVRYA